jgi:predicted signal transduction protein with EAL and GGDEF domain
VARFSGDEFLIMAPGLMQLEQATYITNRLLGAFDRPIEVEQHQLHLSASIGVTLFPDDATSTDALLKNAEIAMYGAKDSGKNSYQFFTHSMHTKATRRMILENEIRCALANNEFMVFYQPKLDLGSNRICGMEALVRWQKGDGSMVSPVEFIPIAEETGLILQLGKLVLESSCRFTLALPDLPPGFKVSVNLSSKQFADPDLVTSVAETLEKTGLPASNLELEVTETSIISDIAVATEKLQALAGMGISIAIDDFGTGYSSLYYLKHLPLHVIKVDRSFIRDLATDPNDAIITSTIISLGKQFGLTLVAEGVETEDQLDFLCKQQCDQIQGYLFARPMPEEELRTFLARHNKSNVTAS